MLSTTKLILSPRSNGFRACLPNDADLIRRGAILRCPLSGAASATCRSTWSLRPGGSCSLERGPFVMRPWRFAVRGTVEAWRGFWRPVPEPGWHDLFALRKRGVVTLEGDLHPLMSNLQYVKDLLALPRRRERGELTRWPSKLEPIVGRYMTLDLEGRPHRLLFRGGRAGHSARLPAHRGRRWTPVPPPDARRGHHPALSRARLRHAVAWQVAAAGGLAEARSIASRLRAYTSR